MNITFLGQGFLPDGNSPVGEYLMKFLLEEDFHSFTGFSAFASEAGVVGLSDHFKKAKEKFENLTLIVGVDQKGTSKEALDAILDLDISAHIFYQLSFPIFHPKIYLFEGEQRTELIIGSSNLTTQGMFINVEASLLVSIDNGDEADRKVVDDLKAYFNGLFELSDPNLQPLTVELIEELVAQKVVPTESERKQQHDKQEQQEKEKNYSLIGKLFPKER
ncbi:MAG: phospholipase D family protein [Saprospiraceae bacterium]|nr:phospholipase D family protein [Saprospiraceae bacterium]MCF8248745.1 phospholipase D family protein [Saprospiraceae bacterium]MCF8278765.1 phospholipase D family protein [Bacteroidales bacterium]MCF8310565.1 phospholipase D family protein [Saprospiraceae bacterium]MCF8439124.1 phospholipase D family protein [Saprospiraceae bacterium]